MVTDSEVLERRELIREVMCQFRVAIDPHRYSREWPDLTLLADDGLVRLSQADGQGLVEVTASGRWLIRTVAAVFDPSQRRAASGSRLI